MRSTTGLVRLAQRLLDPIAVRYAGDHWLRDPTDHLADLDFVVDTVDRRRAGIVERVVATKRRRTSR